MATPEPKELVRKQLEHVSLNDMKTIGREILEDNGLYHNEYKVAYHAMVGSLDLTFVDDDEYWGSTTSDIFFLTVNLVQMLQRDVKRYDKYVEYMLHTFEAVGDDNGIG